MAYTADDLRKMRERGTTRASSSDSKRKYTADDLMAMRGKTTESNPIYTDYAKQAVQNKYRYNSLDQYDKALEASKPADNKMKRIANAGIDFVNAINPTPATLKRIAYTDEEQAYNDLKTERNLYAQEHAFDNYKKYQSNSDYALKSSIDNVTSTLDRMPASAQGGRKNLERIYRDMTDEEKAMANYLASSDNTKEFADYMMNMSPVVDKRIYEQKVKEKEDYSGSVGHDIALSAQHVGENLIGTVGSWGDYLNAYAHGYTPNPYGGAAGMGNLAQEDLRIVSNDIGNEVGSFLYNTGMSTIDSAIGAAIFGEAYAPLMGTAAFNTTYKDLSEKGASKEEILLGAGLAGAAETVFEKVSIENLIKAKPNLKNMKNLATEIIKQAGIEASEEYFTELSNIITDELTQGANSEVSLMYRDLQNKGLSEDEINKEVAKELSKRVGEAALGGLISGGLMGGMFNYGQYRSNTNIGKNTDRAELSQAIENLNPESEVAKEYKGKDLTNLKDTEIGALVMDAYNQADVDAREKYQNAVRSGLENLGLSEGEVKDFYDAIFAEKPSKVQKLLKENETIKNLMSEINRTIAPEIAESARRNKYDIAKTVSNKQGIAKALKKSDLMVGTVTELNGENVKVTDVIKDGDKITVVTNKGEADPKDLTLSAKDANLVMIASGMENNTMRKAYLNNYHGQNVAEYTDSFSTAYSYGKNGVTEETLLEDIGQTINLSIEDATNIYQQGASEIKKSSNEVIETSEEIKKIMKGFRKGTFDDSKIDKKKLSASQRGAYALAQLWLDLGINVSLFNDTSEDSENGYYKDGTIYINLSARYTKQNLKFDRGYVINTMAHELTHWMEDTDSEAFKALKTAIFNYYGEEKTNRLVAQEQQRYEKEGKTLSKKAAESEVIARACEDMLSSSDTLEQILLGCSTDQRNTITRKIREFIDRLGEFLNKILHGNMSPSEAARMLRESAEDFERVRQIWADTFTSAVNTVQNMSVEEMAMDAVLNDNQAEAEALVGKVEDTKLNSIKLDGELANKSLEANKKYRNVDERVLSKSLSFRKTIANRFSRLSDLLPDDIEGNIITKNDSYIGSVEHSLICVRSLINRWFIDKVAKEIGRPLSAEEQIVASEILAGKVGNQRECQYCYVAADRRSYEASFGKYLIDITNLQKDVVENKKKYEKEMAFLSKNYENLKKICSDKSARKKYVKGEHQSDIAGLVKFLNKRDFTLPMLDRYMHAVNDALNGRGKLEGKHLLSESVRASYANDPDIGWYINDATHYSRSATKAKLTGREVKIGKQKYWLEYVAYNGNILDMDEKVIEELNSEYGLRLYSDSDYVPAFLLEDMQVITDAAIRGLKMLAYTKDLGFVKVFAPTGININMSTYGTLDPAYKNDQDLNAKRTEYKNNPSDETRNAYLDALNKYVISDAMQGVEWNDAKAMRDEFDNVGVVFVATNDDLVEFAMAQDWIDVVIPYHTVFAGLETKEYFGYENYKDTQGDRKIKKGDNKWKEGNLKMIPPTIHENNLEKYEKALKENGLTKRFPQWADNPNYMKLVNETRKPYNETKPVQPTFGYSDVETEMGRILLEGKYGLGNGFNSIEDQERVFKEDLKTASDLIKAGKTSKEDLEKFFAGEPLFSNKVDSNGNELTEEQQEFFAKSEIRYSDKIEGSTTEQKISDILQNKYNIGEKEANNEAKGLREIIRRASNNSGRRSGISSVSDKETVALGITTEFVNFGKIDWRGRKLNYDNEKGAYELASYAMLLRNPAYETSRIFYTKGDAIIANDAYTTRLSDATKISDKATNKDAFDDISKKMSRYGADGFYMMHNHPSGSVKPSKLDVETTKLYGNIKGFRGHIVIDHNKYSLIDKSGTYVTADISDGKAIDYNKRVVDHPLLYSKISNADDVGRIAAAITHSPNYSVVLYASSSAEIRMIEAVHDNFVQSKGFEGYIANNKSKIGASWAFLCTENADVYNKSTLKDLYTRTIFKDVVNYQTFNSYMSDGLNQDPSYAGNGKKLNDTKVYKVSDAESTYYSIKDDGFEEKDSKTLGLTDERIDKLLSGGYYGSTQQNYAQAYITYMSPDDFLKLTTGKNQRALERIKDWQNGEWNDTERPAFSMDEFANTYDYQPIQLNIDEENHEVIGHEGRHRMWQIKQLGYNRVPVLLFNYDNKYTKTPIVGMDLMPQWFSEKDDSLNEFDKVIVRDLIPFSQGNRDLIKKKFGTESEADYKFNKKVDAEDLLGRNKRLEKENKALEADVQALKDYIKADSRLSDGKVWNPVNLNALAKNLAGNAKSDIDLKKLRKQLSTAYTYISDQLKNDGSWENIMDECYAVASDIYDDIKNKPTLTKKLIASEIKKAGITADSEVISQVQDVVSEANKDDFLRNLAIEVYHGYWKASALKTSADMANEKQQANIDQLKRLKFEHRKTMDWMLAEQKLADEMHFGKEIAKVVREKEKLKRLVDSVRENRDRKLIELKEFVKNRDEKHKNDAEKRKLITRITDISTDLMKRIERPEKGKTVPAALQQPLLDLVRAIDYSSAQLLGRGKNAYTPTQKDARLGDLINRVSIAVNTIKEQNADSNDAFALAGLSLSPEYGEMLQKIADNINQIESATDLGREYTLQLMTTEDLQVLSDMLTDLKTNINNLNRAMTRENAHSVDYIGEAILKHRDGVGARNINKITQPIAKFMSIMNKTPYYFFKHLGQGGDEAFSFLMDGWDKYAFLAKHISNFTKELYKPEQVQKWDSTLHTFTITLPQTFEEMAEGKQETRDLTLSESQLMSLYCMTKRPQALKHILDGNGIVIDEIDLKGKLKNIAEQKATVVSQADIAKMIEIVESDSEMKRVADAIQKFMSTESAKWINEIYFKLHGTYLALEDNYFPISVDQKTMRSEAKEKNQSLYSLLNQSWTKPLQPNAKNQVIIANIFDVFTDHATSTAKYNALALPVLDMIKIWNYAEVNERGNEGKKEINNVKMALADMMGNEGNQYISHLLHDINGDSESGRYDDLMMKWVKKSKLAKVAANLQTALLQPLSYIRGAYSMSPKYLSKALLMSPKEVKKYIDKTFDSVGVAIWKDMGFYDTNLTASLAKIVRNSETIVDKAVDATLKPAEWMDKVTWGYLYKAVELEIKDKYSTLTGEAFNSKMHDRLREVLYGTQVFDSTLSRTDMMRSKSTFVKVATAFGSEPILHINMLMDAVTEFWYEKKRTNTKNAMIQYGRNLTRAGLVYLVSAIIESTLRAVIGKYKKYDDEDDEEFEGLAEDIYKRTLEELNPLTKLPFTKDIMSIANGYQHKDMNYEFVSSTINAWKDMLKAINNREATFNTIIKIFDAASLWTGMPFANALKEFKALWNNLIGRFTGWMIK